MQQQEKLLTLQMSKLAENDNRMKTLNSIKFWFGSFAAIQKKNRSARK
jgi:hypothetical protein